MCHDENLRVGVRGVDRGHETSERLFRQRRKPLHGFTLIELLVVISIIALLVGILLPALGAARESAKSMVCKTKLKQVAIGYELWLNDSNRRALSKQARGSRWPLALLARYPNEIASPGEKGNLEDSTLICPNDAEPTLNDSGQQEAANYTVEVGGSYYMNNDINNYGPGDVDSGARTQPKWNLIWFNNGADNGGNKAVELWAGDKIDAVKATSSYAMFWDSPGQRWQNNQPFRSLGGELLTAVPKLWYFHGGLILNNITPDPDRHRGTGNILYFDSHVDAKSPEEIDYDIIRWDNVNEQRQ